MNKIILISLLTLMLMVSSVISITPQNNFDFRTIFTLQNVLNISTTSIEVGGKEVCLFDGTNCPASGSGSKWNITGSLWIVNNSGVLDWNSTKGNFTYWTRDINLINETFGNLTYVNVDGDTMSGVLDMGDNAVTNTVIQCSNVTKPDGDFCLLNTTIDSKIAATTETFIPSICETDQAITNGGTTINASTIDGTFIRLSETVADAFQINCTFTGVNTFNSVITYENYSGGAGHVVDIDIQRCSDSGWDTFDMFNNQDIFVLKNHLIAIPNNYICGSEDNVTVRFNHITPGSNSHVFELDSINLVFSSGAAGSGIGGSGTSNTVTKWLDGTSLGNSIATDDGTTFAVVGPLTANTLDTGQGANELFGMDQPVLTTSDVIHNNVNLTGNLTINQNNKFIFDKAKNICAFSNTTHLILSNNLTGVTC